MPRAIWETGRRTHKSDEGYLTFYKLFDQHYKEFLSASTVLASLTPPGLREEVLGIEDLWEEINKKGFLQMLQKKLVVSILWTEYTTRILDSISLQPLHRIHFGNSEMVGSTAA